MDIRDSDWFEPVEVPRGWVYTLHPGVRVRRVGFGCLLFIIVWSMIVPAVFVLGLIASMAPKFGWPAPYNLIVLIALTVLIAGFVLAIVVAQQCCGHDERRLDARAIRAICRLGPVSWSRIVRRTNMVQLTVVRHVMHWVPDPGRDQPSCDYMLVAEDGARRRRKLVGNYQRDMLLALAVELSSRWKALSIDPDLGRDRPREVAVCEESDVPTDIRERFYAPPGTRLLFERQGDGGVRMTMPPHGFLSTRFLVCSLLGILSLVAAIAFAVPPILGMNGEASWVGLALLVLLGVGLLVAAAKGAIDGCVLVATPDSLTRETRGLRGVSCKAWKKAEIASIRAETEVIDGEESTTYVTRVLIRTKISIEPKPDELLARLPKPELESIATTLRGVLGVPASDAPTKDEIQAGSG